MEHREAKEAESLSDAEVTQVAVEALFFVCLSDNLRSFDDVIENVSGTTGHDVGRCSQVIARLVDSQHLMHPVESAPDDGSKIIFGTKGLWLLEDAFAHNDESIDSMALAQRILTQDRFFKK